MPQEISVWRERPSSKKREHGRQKKEVVGFGISKTAKGGKELYSSFQKKALTTKGKKGGVLEEGGPARIDSSV